MVPIQYHVEIPKLNLKTTDINCGHMWVNSECAVGGGGNGERKSKTQPRNNSKGTMCDIWASWKSPLTHSHRLFIVQLVWFGLGFFSEGHPALDHVRQKNCFGHEIISTAPFLSKSSMWWSYLGINRCLRSIWLHFFV